MDKKKAIALAELEQQLDLCNDDCMTNLGWLATTSSLLSKYTEEDSPFFKEYTRWLNTTKATDEVQWIFSNRQKRYITPLIEDVIQHVERNGVYVPPKKGILLKELNIQSIAAFLGICAVVFGAGVEYGKFNERNTIVIEQVSNKAELDSFRRGQKLAPAGVARPKPAPQIDATNRTEAHKHSVGSKKLNDHK